MRAGFNVYDSEDDIWRSYYGYSEEIEIVLGENAWEADYAISGLSNGLHTVICLLLVYASLF